MNNRNHNIDIIKALAIISVILLHGLPREALFLSGAPFHIWQTVPVFMLLAGYNAASSYSRRGYQDLRDFYNYSFLYGKVERIIYPFLLIWVVQILAQYVISDGLTFKELGLSILSGGWGPGSYFIPVIIQATLILPIIYLVCKKNLTLNMILLFILSLILEWLCLLINIPEGIYRLLIIRYIFALVLGVWLVLSDQKIKYKVLIPLGMLSLIYITGVNYFDWSLIMEKFWLSQHAPSYFWTVLLIIFGLRVHQVKSETALSRLSIKIGQASYHIFLVQMFYFWSIAEFLSEIPLILYIVISLLFCLLFGVLFYEADNLVRKIIRERKIKDKVVSH